MQFQPHIILSICGLLLALCYGHAISNDLFRPALRDDEECPDWRAVCSSGKGSKFIRLAPRMKLPADFDDMDDFMVEQTEAASNVVTDDTTCTAVYSAPRGSPVNWAVKEMCGCTALIVVSEKAIYFSHYFENLAFCGKRGERTQFKKLVLDALDNGAKNQESLAAHSSDFKDQTGLAAFIMTPTTEKSDALEFKEKVERLQNKVKDIVGISPKVVRYHPEDCKTSTVLGENALGTALFQYDPKQNKNDPKALSKIWVEKSDIYEHNWNGPPSITTIPAPSCAGIPDDTLDVAFPQPDGDTAITEFCSTRGYWNQVIVPLVSFGTGITSDGRHKSLGILNGFPVNGGADTLWLGLSFSYQSCNGGFQFDIGANDDEKIAHCVDRFRTILNGCNTDTVMAKYGGGLNDNCAVYRMAARKPDAADPMILTSQRDPGVFSCKPTDTSAIGGSSSVLNNTCTCWYSNIPGVTDVFKMPSSNNCNDTDKGALLTN